jgi:hypothetical protein
MSVERQRVFVGKGAFFGVTHAVLEVLIPIPAAVRRPPPYVWRAP